MCGTTYNDGLVLYSLNYTNSANNVFLQLTAQTDDYASNEGFAMRNFFVFIDTCHITCASCSGPNYDQCLTCPSNALQTGSTCQCNFGYYSYDNTCVTFCQTGYIIEDFKRCVPHPCTSSDCSSCVNNKCSTCINGKKLLNGECVASCPNYAPLAINKCVDMQTSLINGVYLLKGLYSDYFGESQVSGLMLGTYGFLGNTDLQQTGAKVTKCQSKSIVGGAYLAGKGAYIQRNFTSLGPHWSIAIGYAFYRIDNWEAAEKTELLIDGVVKVIQQSIQSSGSSICGLISQFDIIYQISSNFTHTSDSMSLVISTNLDQDPFDESFGIREMFVLIDYCIANCISCDGNGCLQCKKGNYLLNVNYCEFCDSTCDECSGAGKQKCTKCKPGTYLNPDNSCKSTCPDSFLKRNSDLTCQPCHQTCYQCSVIGDENSCTACSGSLYLQNTKCVSSCDATYAKVEANNNNTCQKCHSSCLTCETIESNRCLSCQGPSLFLQPATKQCISFCNQNQYQNTSNQQCGNCDPSCSTCSGEESSKCLSCSSNLQLQNSSCLFKCPDDTFRQSESKCDIQCHFKCNSGCSGTSEDDCNTKKVIYQTTFYILIAKSSIFFLSYIWSLQKDLSAKNNQNTKLSSNEQNQQKNNQEQDIQFSPLQLNRNPSANTDYQNDKISDQNILKINQLQQLTNMNTPNGFGTPEKRKRSKFFDDPLKVSSIAPDSPQTLINQQIKKYSIERLDTEALQFTLADFIEKQNPQKQSINPQELQSMFSQYLASTDYETDQKLRYTIYGNEWISLFKFDDPFISRTNRATLIYIKYQIYFIATYEFSIQYVAVCLLLGWAAKLILKQFLTKISRWSRFGNLIANILFAGAIGIQMSIWFVPKMTNQLTQEDKNNSIFYCSVFAADFIIFQQLFSLFQYLMTIEYLNNKNQKGIITMILSQFKNNYFLKDIKK